MSVPNTPYGPGYDEQSSTALASQLAYLLDQLETLAHYAEDTYSPYTSAEIAATWAAKAVFTIPPVDPPPDPTSEQLAKANDFKGWMGTVQTAIDGLYAGDVGYQIKKWRNAAPPMR